MPSVHEHVIDFFFCSDTIVIEKIIIQDQGFLHGVHKSQNRHSTFVFWGPCKGHVYADNHGSWNISKHRRAGTC